MDIRTPPIIIAGCGPGSLDYLTPAARKAVEQADVLIGAGRLLELFPGHGAEKIIVGSNVEKILGEIVTRRRKRIVILVTGDPGLCSLARPVLKRFGRNACEVIPGVSSVQVAFARIGLDWLDARIIDAHGDNPDLTQATLVREDKIAIFAGRTEAIKWIAGLAKVVGEGRRIYLCENLTLEDEKIRQVQPDELDKLEASSRCIVLMIKEDLFR